MYDKLTINYKLSIGTYLIIITFCILIISFKVNFKELNIIELFKKFLRTWVWNSNLFMVLVW